MIRIKRCLEPRGRLRARNLRLPRAVAAYNASQDLTDLLAGYASEKAKLALFRAQHKKCAWCERRSDFSSAPIEHFRPKGGAWRHLPGEPARVDIDYYWWLTWTWTNLYFSCARCNDQAHKANYFPLVPGTGAAPLPSRPVPLSVPAALFEVAMEKPLLLDPTSVHEDPMDHIAWRPLDTTQARRLWQWSPIGLTDRGRTTVKVLKLEELADEVEHRLIESVLPSIEEIEKHLSAGRTDDAMQRWERLLADVLAPEASLSGAIWWALNVFMPESRRREQGLPDPRRPGSF